MSLPQGDAEKVLRLAVLDPEAVEIPHPTIPGYFICGWAFRADELHAKGDGFKIIRAMERLYRVKWRAMRLSMRGV